MRPNAETKTPDGKSEAEAANNGHFEKQAGTTGAGLFTALSLAAETGDICRFRDRKNLVSWAGPYPTVPVWRKTHRGEMKKIGAARPANRGVCGAANRPAGHDPGMRAVYESARKRRADMHGPAVAAANKTPTCMRYMPDVLPRVKRAASGCTPAGRPG